MRDYAKAAGGLLSQLRPGEGGGAPMSPAVRRA